MSAGTLREIGGHADDDFNWGWYEDQMRQGGDAGPGPRRGYDDMMRREVGAQRLGRMSVGAEYVPAAEAGNNLLQMAAEESLQRLAQMGLRYY